MRTNVKNIIFDFGGVIINIDPMAVLTELRKFAIVDASKLHQYMMANDIYAGLETDRISPAQFRDIIRKQLGKPMTDDQVDVAWNSIIRDIPPERMRLLEGVRKNYRTFLLSNSNRIHNEYYNRYIREKFGYHKIDSLFEKAYFSFLTGMYKPDPGIFKYVLDDSRLIPGETLFIDDSKINTDAAAKTGMQTFHLDGGTEMTELFDETFHLRIPRL
jgi:FMN phosphatase YigB (HAD superfamily)